MKDCLEKHKLEKTKRGGKIYMYCPACEQIYGLTPVSRPKSVLITGAGSGIGKATAKFLAGKGYFVIATGRREKTLEKFREIDNVTALKMDVTKPEDAQNALEKVKKTIGKLDIIINNAGIARKGPLVDVSEDEFKRHFEVNVFGSYYVTKTFFPLLRESKGRIINVSSMAELQRMVFYGAYISSKVALRAMNDILRRELAPFGIKVSIILPGGVRTPIWDKTTPDLDKEYLNSPFRERMQKVFTKIGSKDEDYEKGDWKAKALSPEIVVNAIYHAITSKNPRRVYMVAKGKSYQVLFSKLPVKITDWMLFKYY